MCIEKRCSALYQCIHIVSTQFFQAIKELLYQLFEEFEIDDENHDTLQPSESLQMT